MEASRAPEEKEETHVSQRCLVCGAQATGFHFEAQSCSACTAFFRRTIALSKNFRCINGSNNCAIHYSMHQMCRSCRYSSCIQNGMNKAGEVNEDSSPSTPMLRSPPLSTPYQHHHLAPPQPHQGPNDENGTLIEALEVLIREEMRLGEKRRIVFCERPVEKMLGVNKNCPFTREEIRPLSFRSFRKSIRTHILFIYDWLETWPDYAEFDNTDRVSLLRSCVLLHSILDPIYITLQIGLPDRFVMQNGGYMSCVDEGGWQDEAEISSNTKKMFLSA